VWESRAGSGRVFFHSLEKRLLTFTDAFKYNSLLKVNLEEFMQTDTQNGNNNNQKRRDLVAQWTFDTRAILARFHLWLEDVEVKWLRGEGDREFTNISFLDGRIERLFAMTGAVTALGTQLFGSFGGAKGKDKDKDKSFINQVKKDADAISAYAMSESLWFLSRQIPENHAIMVCLGEGLMPKAGETPEMGSNPQLGFGRVYARPEVARWVDQHVVRMLNDKNYHWENFFHDLKKSGITIWGAAIDTLENTSRFAKGKDTGPMTVLHVFNQPLQITRPYEGYVGNLFLPKEVVQKAAEESILINFRTPRAKVVAAIEAAYPGIKRENIHVWTLGGESRVDRIGKLWEEWKTLGVHVVEDGWVLPTTGVKTFNDSGTYAPTYAIGAWKDAQGETNLFICDGYAASAEALQAASLARMLGLEAFLAIFTSSFKLPYNKEQYIMALDPRSPDFKSQLEKVIGKELDNEKVNKYAGMIQEGLEVGIPVQHASIQADDFFPEKKWDVLAVAGYMQTDPYSGSPGVELVQPPCKEKDNEHSGIYRVTVRMATPHGDKLITFTLKLWEKTENQSRLVFQPLLNRFIGGEDYQNRPVRISDSGRIRNELQTLCSEALEFLGERTIRIHFDRIPVEVISNHQQVLLLEILQWYKKHHPIWFSWLEIEPPTK
jgi:hypothetical protein